MNLNALRFFYEASQYDTLTEASQHLHISQPALTKHIKNLEKDYHVHLVEKQGRNVVLTDLGQQIVTAASVLFEQEKQIETLLTNHQETQIIGTTQLNSDDLMRSLLANDDNNYHLSFMTENTHDLITKLKNKTIDYAILPERHELADLPKDYLFSDELIFVAHPDYCPNTLQLKELSQYHFIKREVGSSLQEQLDRHINVPLSFQVEVSGHLNAITACQLKKGIYLTSKKSVNTLLSEKKLIEVTIKEISFNPRAFYLYTNHSQQKTLYKQFLVYCMKKE